MFIYFGISESVESSLTMRLTVSYFGGVWHPSSLLSTESIVLYQVESPVFGNIGSLFYIGDDDIWHQ